jgi:MOSC domain-containing protein YiiM
MRETFGHSNLGVFAKVIKSGEVKVGDELRDVII